MQTSWAVLRARLVLPLPGLGQLQLPGLDEKVLRRLASVSGGIWWPLLRPANLPRPAKIYPGEILPCAGKPAAQGSAQVWRETRSEDCRRLLLEIGIREFGILAHVQSQE